MGVEAGGGELDLRPACRVCLQHAAVIMRASGWLSERTTKKRNCFCYDDDDDDDDDDGGDDDCQRQLCFHYLVSEAKLRTHCCFFVVFGEVIVFSS